MFRRAKEDVKSELCAFRTACWSEFAARAAWLFGCWSIGHLLESVKLDEEKEIKIENRLSLPLPHCDLCLGSAITSFGSNDTSGGAQRTRRNAAAQFLSFPLKVSLD